MLVSSVNFITFINKRVSEQCEFRNIYRGHCGNPLCEDEYSRLKMLKEVKEVEIPEVQKYIKILKEAEKSNCIGLPENQTSVEDEQCELRKQEDLTVWK